MNTKNLKLILASLYVYMTVLNVLLWILFPETIQFIGASSLIDIFLFSLGIGKRWITLVILAWIPVFLTSLIASYIITIKKKKYFLFCVIAGIDILISLFLIVYKISIKNYTDLNQILVGFSSRIIYYIGMLYCLHKKEKNC